MKFVEGQQIQKYDHSIIIEVVIQHGIDLQTKQWIEK